MPRLRNLFALAVSFTGAWLLASSAVRAAEEPSTAKPAPGIELGAPFRDHAILQREMPLPVWGWSKSGTTITVEFAGQKETAMAGADGKWMLRLKPLMANSQPAVMTIRNSEGQSIALADLLVGEVWHASGQSNMEWLAGKSNCNSLAEEIAKAKDELPIRELRTDTVSALYPQQKVTSEAGWKTSRAAGGFSALALAFAYELHQELKVPVGILLTSHSNTRIEAFTERKAIEAHPALKVDVDLIHKGDARTEQGQAAFEKYYRDLAAWQKASAEQGFPVERPINRPNLPGIAGEWRGPSQFFNGKIAPVVPYAVRGSLWCQGESNSGDGRLYAARMEALLRGWRDAWDMPKMPFYFTQMQCYGDADSAQLGFADIRQVQHQFFLHNRSHVGMVVQTDINSTSPGFIHYSNKLHAGMRLARWALAKDYGRDIAYTGPIYEKYTVDGGKVVVSFEQGSLFGGLMAGSKELEMDSKDPTKFVEPAQPTPGEKLNHFRLCGADRKWHPAEAVIVGDTVVVTAREVPQPIGVQYAYSAAPRNANLYNKAGLPATPFAAAEGKLIFEDDNPAAAAAQDPTYVRFTDPDFPILQLAEYFRDGAIIQRDRPIPVWGHANRGVEITVTLGGVTKSAVADDKQQWSVRFPALKASTQPLTLSVKDNRGQSKLVQDILVGDVWFVTGSTLLTSETAIDRRDQEAKLPAALPLVREFRRRTSATTHPNPRKRAFEIGGDRRYRSFWQPAEFTAAGDSVSMFAYEFATSLNRPGIPQGFVTMSSGWANQMASPLSWTSYAGMKDTTHPPFQKRLEELLLHNPDSAVARKAIAEHVQSVKATVAHIAQSKPDTDLSKLPLQFPPFPEADKIGSVKPDAVPTLVYNFCVSPLTPMAVAGVIWVPGKDNLGYDPADYTAELELYARSLPETYGLDQVQFLYAHPTAKLVPGVTPAKIEQASAVEFDQWPESLREIARGLGAAASGNSK